MTSFPLRLGVHVSISGGIEKAVLRARELGCTAMQIFSRNPRSWEAAPLAPRAIRAFQEEAGRSDMDPIVIHTPYLLNLASSNGPLHRKSMTALAQDLKRAGQLGARLVVTHLGSGKDGSPSSGRKQVVRALKKVLEESFPASLLLENSAGAGYTVGRRLEEIGEIIGGVGGDSRVGFCFDSCHGYAAGYDFRSEEGSRALVEEMDRVIGLDRLGLLHLNDCAGPLGGHLDRHQHIGKGQIGLKGFRSLLGQASFRRVPMILETPKEGPGDDRKNLGRIRDLFPSLQGSLSG